MNREILGPVSHGYFSQRLRLHYIDWGNTEAPPMLLLHGGRDHCRSWDWIARQFSDDWHVIAPDLRGHGDSDWVADGNYEMAAYLYDIDQLIFQQNLSPVMIVAHSLGGNIALRYSGLYPENVHAVVAIEGLGLSPKMQAELRERSLTERLKGWIKKRRDLAGRLSRKYASIEEAVKRMKDENQHLTEEMATHLTAYGVNQNEDGTFSWKFDNYVRSWPAYDMPATEVEGLWGQIDCPTLLIHGPRKLGVGSFKRMDAIDFLNLSTSWVSVEPGNGYIMTAQSSLFPV